MAELPDNYREIVVLRFWEDLDYADIAKALAISEGLARWRVHRGRKLLLEKLLAMIGKLLLRENRDFHTIQTIEGAFKQYKRWQGTEVGTHALIAAARYLAAHAPTVRAQGQTYDIAHRLHRGERLFEE